MHGPAGRSDCGTARRVGRRRLVVGGRVHGVGFRPFVYRLATEMGLAGLVANDPRGALIEVEGPAEQLDSFAVRLRREVPQLVRISEVTARALAPRRSGRFEIQASASGGPQDAEITPDAATCDDCLSELLDPGDRRYRYPFINCTNCGPRYSIIFAVPYDRPNTTMSRFEMCPECRREYEDPSDRRFHAQPNACPACGPRVWLAGADGAEIEGDAVGLCAQRLGEGAIVAVKGIGGFHLACRANDDSAVARLRRRKHRDAKPMALMVPSLETARRLARIDADGERALTDVARPIVLLPRLAGAEVSGLVAGGVDSVGIMLPYTPLHHLLFAEGLGPLVMTSGNRSDEPLCSDNGEALERLGGIADAFLLHDRDIERRVDDSVVVAVNGAAGGVVPIRRARGQAPAPIKVCEQVDVPVLAVGGELKSTVCVLSGSEAILSEHLGDLSNPGAYRHFVATVDRFKALLGVEPRLVACDAHPVYAASRYARGLGLPVTEVQHHHAHVVSCMAENGVTGRVIGLACDGTGYGSDGAIWGCEVLLADEVGFDRLGCLRYFPLPGGDSAAKETWRPAAGLLRETLGGEWWQAGPFNDGRVPGRAVATWRRLLERNRRMPRTSSLGRLFDGVAFLLGVCDRNRHEAEAAMTLETVARRCAQAAPLRFAIAERDCGHGAGGPGMSLDFRPMVRDLIDGMGVGRPIAELARAFHETVAAMLVEAANRAAEATGVDRVVLSGGCFANRLLLEGMVDRLSAAGREVIVHRTVPAGDGGISLGQAVVAAARYRKGMPARVECGGVP